MAKIGAACVLFLALGLAPARAHQGPGPFALRDLAAHLLQAYNAHDVEALHALLAPGLRDLYPPDRLARALTLCRVLTHDILRLGIPTGGSRFYGFFEVHAETKMFEMIVEVDAEARIVHLLITDDAEATEQQCLIAPSSPTGPNTQ